MIEILLNNPRVLHQKPDFSCGISEPAISACSDASGLLVISQEGREIILNPASLDEFVKMLRGIKSADSAA